MKKIYSGFTVLSLLLVFSSAKTQVTDFQTRWGIEVSGELFNLIDVEVNPEIRFWDNSSRYETFVTELEASVPVTKYLRFGLLYRQEMQNKNQEYVHYGNRFGAFGQADYKIHRLKIAYRLIYQQEYMDWHTSESGYIPVIEHRHKVSLKYNIRKSKFEPSVAGEMFFTVRPESQNGKEKIRITAGLSYKLNKHNDISLQYKWQRELFENNPFTVNILGVTLSHDL